MSTEALDRIIKEAKALTPEERRELIDRLAHEEQNSHGRGVRKPGSLKGTVAYMAPDFDDSVFSNLSTHADEIAAGKATLRDWLSEARNTRMGLPLTSNSVDILRELREVRSRQ
jgi:hypothetical protein